MVLGKKKKKKKSGRSNDPHAPKAKKRTSTRGSIRKKKGKDPHA